MQPQLTPEQQARMARRPRWPRWEPYEVGPNGKVTLKANAKLLPAGAKKPKLDVPPPAATWATPPYASWPAAQKQ
jgi:hypothetical protein